MHLTSLHFLFLIPAGLALAFLFWVLWSVTGQLRKEDTQPGSQPMVSIRVRDRYSLSAPAAPVRTTATEPTAIRGQVTAAERRFSALRQPSVSPYAPTLGIGLREASSSAVPALRR